MSLGLKAATSSHSSEYDEWREYGKCFHESDKLGFLEGEGYAQ